MWTVLLYIGMNEEKLTSAHRKEEYVNRSEHVAHLEIVDSNPVWRLVKANDKFFGTGTGLLNAEVMNNILMKEYKERKAVGDSDKVITDALEHLLQAFLPKEQEVEKIP